MRLPEFDSLYTFAEIAVGLAGFAAIVVLFRRRDQGLWAAVDADQFNGMVGHSMMGALFCVIPTIIAVFASTPASVWSVSSGMLGIQIVVQTIFVTRFPTTVGWRRTEITMSGLGTTLILGLNTVGVGFDREFGPFLIGILWHLIHAGILFVSLVLIPPSSIERPSS